LNILGRKFQNQKVEVKRTICAFGKAPNNRFWYTLLAPPQKIGVQFVPQPLAENYSSISLGCCSCTFRVKEKLFSRRLKSAELLEWLLKVCSIKKG